MRGGGVAVRAVCGPKFPFAPPEIQVAVPRRDALVRGLWHVLCPDTISEVARHLPEEPFEPADGLLSSVRWSPALRVADLVALAASRARTLYLNQHRSTLQGCTT